MTTDFRHFLQIFYEAMSYCRHIGGVFVTLFLTSTDGWLIWILLSITIIKNRNIFRLKQRVRIRLMKIWRNSWITPLIAFIRVLISPLNKNSTNAQNNYSQFLHLLVCFLCILNFSYFPSVIIFDFSSAKFFISIQQSTKQCLCKYYQL